MAELKMKKIIFADSPEMWHLGPRDAPRGTRHSP